MAVTSLDLTWYDKYIYLHASNWRSLTAYNFLLVKNLISVDQKLECINENLGTVLGFSAILLPQLEREVDLSADQKSWIASLSNIGQYFF